MGILLLYYSFILLIIYLCRLYNMFIFPLAYIFKRWVALFLCVLLQGISLFLAEFRKKQVLGKAYYRENNDLFSDLYVWGENTTQTIVCLVQ